MFEKKEDQKKPAAAGAKTPPAAAAAAAPQRPAVTLRYLDRPDCLETFADSISGLSFDGQTLRLEFAVTRMDDVKPDAPATGRRYPVCRLVLQPLAAVDLINRMQQVGAALAKAGVVKANPPAAPQGKDIVGER
jgi:hypothetical protein